MEPSWHIYGPIFLKHLFSDIAVHLLAIILILVALVGMLVQIFHRHSRKKLRLQHMPGTIASAISFGPGPNLVQLLNSEKDVGALGDRQFRVDPLTMQILMEGDPEEAHTPDPH
jgi:hypothetical protein